MTARPLRPLAAALATVLLVGASLTGCSGDDPAPEEAAPTPEETLAAAKSALDDTHGFRVRLSTEELPPGVTGVVGAEGVGTHAPAFEGELTVAFGGITTDVAVVAVDERVFAELPLTRGFTEIDPAEYGAPDPARLMATSGGLSSLLTAAKDVERGGSTRRGEQVLTEYTGTVPGSAVAAVIPSAETGSPFDARFLLDDTDRLHEAVLTGPFYPDAPEVTYSIVFEDYGTEAQIAVPEDAGPQETAPGSPAP